MSYVSAISVAVDELHDGRRHDVSVVLAGLDLVLCGWQIHTGVGDTGRRAWAVLGTAAQAVVEEFDDLPPVYYTVAPAEDGAEAWRQTVRLVEAIAGRLDRMEEGSSLDLPQAWRLATAAARLRAATAVPA